MEKATFVPPAFLLDLLSARSPTGHEFEAQAVFDRHVQPIANRYEKDAMGNRLATLEGRGAPVFLMTGHIDELGLLISYINNEGFLYFDTLGGHDLNVISGRRVRILTKNGEVTGVTGKRAVHLMDADDRKKAPEKHQLWIDIGAKNKAEAQSLVSIGDPAVYDHGFELLRGSVAVARAFDNKAGAYIVGETLRRLAGLAPLDARVVAAATTQEEIGCRGARIAAFGVQPDVAIAVDVTHATDHPECDNRKFGEIKLGGGVAIVRGPNINPWVFQRLIQLAEDHKIPFQIEAEARPTGTDGREIQWTRSGIATGVLEVPLRYMHTPSEIVDLQDVESAVRLLVAFAQSLQPGDNGHF